MSFPKLILICGCTLFALIGGAAVIKKITKKELQVSEIMAEVQPITPEFIPQPMPSPEPYHDSAPIGHKLVPKPAEKEHEIDRIYQLFTTSSNKFPIVQTLSYSSRVPWLKGRPAWIADYASKFATSRHFIARSLNGKVDYLTQKVSSGDRFNVFNEDKNFQFYLLIDLSRRQLKFYYIDLDTQERVHIKTYPVGLGRLDERSPSGSLTPIGKYTLGSKIATYKPGMKGYFQEGQTEMVQVFGSRWIPFGQEIGDCSAPSKGYGLHGAPWVPDAESGKLIERRETIGMYDSDGCVRLYEEDIEELFSIVITKPTLVEIVKDFSDADLPGHEER